MYITFTHKTVFSHTAVEQVVDLDKKSEIHNLKVLKYHQVKVFDQICKGKVTNNSII